MARKRNEEIVAELTGDGYLDRRYLQAEVGTWELAYDYADYDPEEERWAD